MGISVSGLASGIDSDSLIRQLVSLARAPINNMESKVATYQSVSRKFGNFDTLATSVQTALDDLKDPTSVISGTVESTDDGIVTATATGEAPLGTYTLSDVVLAKSHRVVSNSATSKTDAAGFANGQLSIQVGDGGVSYVNVSDTDSLESLKGKIDELGLSNVSAAIIFDGTSYRLQLSGRDVGAANAITISDTGLNNSGTGLESTDASHVRQSASDASFTMDGTSFTSTSNSIAEAIPGLTIELEGQTSGAESVTLNVTRDGESLVTKAKAFVEAYNALSSAIGAEFAWTGTTKARDTLSGDFTLRGLQRTLREQVGQAIGTGADGSAYTSLSALGIASDRTGQLTLTEATLRTAIANDPAAVTRIFAGDSALGITGIATSLDNALEVYTKPTGFFKSRQDSFTGLVKTQNDAIDKAISRLDGYERQLRAQFSALETTVSSLQSQGNALSSL